MTGRKHPAGDIAAYVRERAARVKAASGRLAAMTAEVKNRALEGMARALVSGTSAIAAGNAKDLAAGRESGLSDALLDRLALDGPRVRAMADGLLQIAALPDPVGEITDMTRRPEGFLVGRMRVPIGVIGIVYESRPNVTADAAALCLKSGNGVVLKGGSEAIHSNTAIARILERAGHEAGLPDDTIALLETTDRDAVTHMLTQTESIDLIIPRGGEGLIRMVTEHSRIPVIKHDRGLCHTYVDRAADPAMAIEIVYNAKVQRPGVCNAVETLLIHEQIVDKVLPALGERLAAAGVTVHACPISRTFMAGAVPAKEGDYDTEWLSLDLSVKVVASFEDAAAHIGRHGSHHTEAIVTGDYAAAMRFVREVDAAAVLVNASSRLHDGGVFGLGAEIGISTSRIHARGAMGLKELTCQKFVVLGEGHLRD